MNNISYPYFIGDETLGRNIVTAGRKRTTDSACAVGGNRKCNPNTWDEFGGYRDGCCTPDQRCGENEGDCSDDSDCLPGFVCGTKNCPKGRGFDDRADCCELFSDVFNPGENFHIVLICYAHIMIIFYIIIQTLLPLKFNFFCSIWVQKDSEQGLRSTQI